MAIEYIIRMAHVTLCEVYDEFDKVDRWKSKVFNIPIVKSEKFISRYLCYRLTVYFLVMFCFNFNFVDVLKKKKNITIGD